MNRRREWLKILCAPGLLLGFNALAWCRVQRAWVAGLPITLVAAAALLWLLERFIPYEAQWNQAQGDSARDLCHALVNEGLCAGAVAMLPLLQPWLPSAGPWPGHWPLLTQWLPGIVLADLGITLMHRASHQLPWLWRFHAVHHSIKRFHGLYGLLKHPVHLVLEMSAGVLPLVLMGLPPTVAALLAFSVALQLLLQHANLDMRLGVLRPLLALAPFHRFHHLKSAREGNGSFGLFLTVRDRLMATAVDAPGRRVQRDDLGMEDRPDHPTAYLAQLMEPWRDPGRAGGRPQ